MESKKNILLVSGLGILAEHLGVSRNTARRLRDRSGAKSGNK